MNRLTDGAAYSPGGAGLPTDFSIFTAGMVPDLQMGTPERPVVRMIGSSTEQDLHRDTMTLSALVDMQKLAASGLLIWLNHDYTVPDSLFGSLCEEPILINKSGVTDLHIAVEVEMDNPAAAKTYRFIQNGRRLGCSVGLRVEDYELVESEAKSGPTAGQMLLHITKVRPVEWSVVGVPANQRSWIENAAQGLFVRTLTEEGREDEALKLAPIVKGLFPKEYKRIVNGLGQSEFADVLKSVTPRPTPAQRLMWEPATQKFFYAAGSQEVKREVERAEIGNVLALLRKSIESATPEPVAEVIPEPVAETVLTAAADDADKQAQEARAHKYGIGIKEGGNVTKPSEWKDCPDEAFGDPVNYRYPMPDKAHADNAASRWGDASNRSQYSSEEQAIIGRRIAARQRHFGETQSDNGKKMFKLISSETQPDGSALEIYENGEHRLVKSFQNEHGEFVTETVIVKYATPEEAEAAEKRSAAEVEKVAAEAGETPADEAAKEEVPASAAEVVEKAPEAGETTPDTHEPAEAVSAPVDELLAAAEHAIEEAKAEEAVIEAKHEAPVVEEQKSVETPAEEPVIETKSLEATPAVDPLKLTLLKSYNDIGKALGFEERSFEPLAKKATLPDDQMMQVKQLVQAADNAVDTVLSILGVPDIDDDENVETKSADLTQKAGRTISHATAKRLQVAHDVLADMSAGAHCAAYIARNGDAPAAMQREENAEKSGGDVIVEKSAAADMEIKVNVDTSALDKLLEQLGALTKAFEGIDTKSLEEQVSATKNELALTRKSLEDAKAEQAMIADNLTTLKGEGLGRPTHTFSMRTAPDAPAAGIGDGQITDPSLTTKSEDAPITSLDEALARTEVKYIPGVGKCRHWPEGVGKGFRPELQGDQMAAMGPADILKYLNNGDVWVPVISHAS